MVSFWLCHYFIVAFFEETEIMPPKKKRNIDGANKDDPDQKIKEFEKMYPIPFVLRNELRTLVCLVCWNIVCQRKSLLKKRMIFHFFQMFLK